MQRPCLAGALLLLLQLTAEVSAHGVLLQPRSRNFIKYLSENFYNAHGLNAGGVNLVSNNNKIRWPHGRTGLCGDSFREVVWDRPGEVQATYMAGQVITVDAVIAVNHLGRIDMKICDLDAKATDKKKCTNLMRADGKGKFWYLPFLSNWTGGNSGFVQPAYSDGSFTWYSLPTIRSPQGCKGQRECDQFMNMIVYRTQWRLPAGFNCRHCKLQWHYLTASTCWPPCPKENQNEPTCRNIQVFPTCGVGTAQYPEEFFNCADVRVVAPTSRIDANTLRQSNRPAWENTLKLNKGKYGQPKAFRMGQYQRRRSLHRRSLLSWLGLGHQDQVNATVAA